MLVLLVVVVGAVIIGGLGVKVRVRVSASTSVRVCVNV